MEEVPVRNKCWCNSDLTTSVHEMYSTCKKCGTLVLLRQLSTQDLEKFYKDSYWTTFMEVNYRKPPIEERAINDFYDRIPFYYSILKKYVPRPNSILEIGCSHGGFLYYCMKNSVPNIVGVEVDENICQFAKNRFGLKHIVSGMFPDVSLPLDSFNAIVCFDVLEHFLDPINTLKAIYDKLSDGGICFFVTPAYRGEDVTWDRFRVDEHIFLYNEMSAQLLFEMVKIEILDIFPSLYSQDMIIIGRKNRNIVSSKISSNLAIPFHEYGPYLNIKILNKEKISITNSIPLISVLLIVGKNDDLCKKSLKSVLSQKYDNIEIIIITEKPMTGKDDITREYKDTISFKIITCEEKAPLSKRFNLGINSAEGSYLAFLTGDSAFYSNHLLSLIYKILDKKCNAVYSDSYRAGQIKLNNEFVTVKRQLIFSNEFDIDKLYLEPLFPLFCALLSKDSITDNKGFDENFDICCDWDFWIRFSNNGTINKVHKITSEYFYRNDNSIITDSMRSQFIQEKYKLQKKYNAPPGNHLNYNQRDRLLTDRKPIHPFPTIQVFMDTIVILIEQKKIPEAIKYYTAHRKFIPPIPELSKFDSVITNLMRN